MAVITSPENLCNEALRAVGWSQMIGDLYEGSPQSTACLEIYAQTRDEILMTDAARAFSRARVALVLLKGPPPIGGYSVVQPWSNIYPPPNYLYEYASPPDMIELRSIQSAQAPMPEFDPQVIACATEDDPVPIVSGGVATGPAQTVILTNLANAVAVYRRRVTDLTLWRAPALAAFIARMAEKLSRSPRLAASADMMKMAPQEAMMAGQVARGHRG